MDGSWGAILSNPLGFKHPRLEGAGIHTWHNFPNPNNLVSFESGKYIHQNPVNSYLWVTNTLHPSSHHPAKPSGPETSHFPGPETSHTKQSGSEHGRQT